MYVVTGHALDFSVVEFYTVSEAVNGVWWTKVDVFKAESGVAHGNGMVISQI